MAVVYHDHSVVLLGQIAHFVQLGNGAVHAEHTIGGDHAPASPLSFPQPGLQIGHIVVLKAEALGLAQANAVNNGSVVEGIADHGILGSEQRLE